MSSTGSLGVVFVEHGYSKLTGGPAEGFDGTLTGLGVRAPRSSWRGW